MRYTRIYRIWNGMKQRCNNPGATNYENYGGRGITYCEHWESFKNFYEDMGDLPFKDATLERIDVNGNYEKSNCKFATLKEQANNTRSNRYITHNGETMTLWDWSKKLNIHQSSLGRRIDNWGVEKALTLQVGDKNSDRFRTLELFGVRKSMRQWSKLSPVSRRAFERRLDNGWNLTQALVFPPMPGSLYMYYLRKTQGENKNN